MATYYKKTLRMYKERQKTPGCPFCSPETLKNVIFENSSIFIVPTLTKYDLWELHEVSNHLMVIPKRHVKNLEALSPKERLAIMDVCAKYEAKGYSIYARGVGFVKRSVEHQHTHMIKVSNKNPRLVLFSQKPYHLIKF